MLNKILIIAGEASGDIHGAELIKEIKKTVPGTLFYGIGGDRMIAEGLEAKYHIKEMAFLGFAEVVKHLPFILKVQRVLLNFVEQEGIEKIVLIDYPGFNLNIAKKLKKLDVKIYYYIAPQIWAWGKKRVKKIKKRIDKMIVVFPFEEEFYKNAGIEVDFVGNPLVNKIENYNYTPKDDFYSEYSLDIKKEILLIMPGSRKHEIEKIFEQSIKAARKLAIELNFQIIIACPENIDDELFDSYRKDYDFRIIRNQSYNLMKFAKFGIIKSGTSTMEAALLKLPFIVVYATSNLTYWIGRTLVKVDNLAMPNIIAGKQIVTEFIQNDLKADKIYSHIKNFLQNEKNIENMRAELLKVKEKLGKKSAAELAAKIICA